MEVKAFQKIMHSVQNKFKKNKQINSPINDYAFSLTELDELKKDNIEKIKELKKDIHDHPKKEEVLDENKLDDSILNKEEITEDVEEEQVKMEEEKKEETLETVENEKDKDKEQIHQPSFIHLEKEHQDLIMNMWKEIDLTELDKDTIQGKDLLNHNYTITYADDAARFIHNIRKKYEVVLCYLIGFNNEKKGIYEKTIFSDHIDNEWKYLSYYIKLLEKIRNFKVH